MERTKYQISFKKYMFSFFLLVFYGLMAVAFRERGESLINNNQDSAMLADDDY